MSSNVEIEKAVGKKSRFHFHKGDLTVNMLTLGIWGLRVEMIRLR